MGDSKFEADPGRQELPSWRLADGAEVPEGTAVAIMSNLQAVLEEYGSIAAADLDELVGGRQIKPTPWAGDLRPVYVSRELAIRYKDDSLGMHDTTRAVVGNALHVNPADPSDWIIIDPREVFEGFDNRSA